MYAAVVVIAIAVVVFTSWNGSKTSDSGVDIMQQQMPDDDIHKNLKKPDDLPTKENVNESAIKQLEELKKSVEENPNDTLKLRQYADYLTMAHKQDEAISYYEKILKVNPKRTDIYISLAYIYFTQSDFNKAEEYTNRILSYDKNNVHALYNLGAIWASSNQKEKAKQVWERIVKEFPDTETSNLARNSLSRLQE